MKTAESKVDRRVDWTVVKMDSSKVESMVDEKGDLMAVWMAEQTVEKRDGVMVGAWALSWVI